jgi:hypothetical protein
MFEYEHTSKYNLSVETRALLVNEIEGDEFHLSPIQGKILLNDIENIFNEGKGKDLNEFKEEFRKSAGEILVNLIDEMFVDLQDFILTDPKIPAADKKTFISNASPVISAEDTREKITDTIVSLAEKSETALLALYVYRQMDKIEWLPFIKAAIERNPVCFIDLNGRSVKEVYEIIKNMPDESIYDGNRLALPDEVWNFRRGDGIEKAFLLADFIIRKDYSSSVLIEIMDKKVCLSFNGEDYLFTSDKSFIKTIKISGNNYIVDNLS